MEWTPRQSATLAAAVDRMIPADRWASATGAGVLRFLAELFDGDRAGDAGRLAAGLDGLDADAVGRHARPFADLDGARQDEVLAAAEGGPFFDLLLNVTAEGYYADTAGGRVPASWGMVGYDPGANRP